MLLSNIKKNYNSDFQLFVSLSTQKDFKIVKLYLHVAENTESIREYYWKITFTQYDYEHRREPMTSRFTLM